MQHRSENILVITAAAVLAALGALPGAYDSVQGLHIRDWAMGTAASLVAAIALLHAADREGRNHSPFRYRAIVAASLAMLAPVATSASEASTLANLAFAATALTAALASFDLRGWRMVGITVTVGLACASDITGLLWPLGYLWAACSQRRDIGRAGWLCAVALCSVFAGRVIGIPMLQSERNILGIHASHRDMVILLPVFMIGLAGYMRQGRLHISRCRADRVPWPAGWIGVAFLGLAVVLVCGLLDARICMLAFWWWMPAGCVTLPETLASGKARGRLVRGVGWLSVLVLAMLFYSGPRQWLDGVLLAVYLAFAS